jgi:hypothetical protein
MGRLGVCCPSARITVFGISAPLHGWLQETRAFAQGITGGADLGQGSGRWRHAAPPVAQEAQAER